MRLARRLLIALVLLAGGAAALLHFVALRGERPVGFQVVRTADANGRALPIAIWYPTKSRAWPTAQMGAVLMEVARDGAIDGESLPLVLISHGNGGGPASHADLAMALAGAGYVVAAPMHPGDNFTDQSAIGSATFLEERPRQLRATLDHLLGAWADRARIDTTRIAAFGFSAGGFTVLAAIGAQPDLRRIATTCAATPEFVCEVLKAAGSPLLAVDTASTAPAFVADPRIRAAVIAAPGLGFTMDSAALAGVRVPVQLWSGEADDKVPTATNALMVRQGLGARVEYHSVPGAGHFSFLTPCGPVGPAALCDDAGGFDRKAFHRRMNASVREFLDRRL